MNLGVSCELKWKLLLVCPSERTVCSCQLLILKLYLAGGGWSWRDLLVQMEACNLPSVAENFCGEVFFSKKYIKFCWEKQVLSDLMMFTVGKTQFTQLFKEFARKLHCLHIVHRELKKENKTNTIRNTDCGPVHNLKSNKTLFCNWAIFPSEFAVVKPAVVWTSGCSAGFRVTAGRWGWENTRDVLVRSSRHKSSDLVFLFCHRYLVVLGESQKAVVRSLKTSYIHAFKCPFLISQGCQGHLCKGGGPGAVGGSKVGMAWSSPIPKRPGEGSRAALVMMTKVSQTLWPKILSSGLAEGASRQEGDGSGWEGPADPCSARLTTWLLDSVWGEFRRWFCLYPRQHKTPVSACCALSAARAGQLGADQTPSVVPLPRASGFGLQRVGEQLAICEHGFIQWQFCTKISRVFMFLIAQQYLELLLDIWFITRSSFCVCPVLKNPPKFSWGTSLFPFG